MQAASEVAASIAEIPFTRRRVTLEIHRISIFPPCSEAILYPGRSKRTAGDQ
jgi:hypothetical protein